MNVTDSAAGRASKTGTAGETWTIAEVAREFGITHRTVRHYEELNLISPERRGTARVYHRRERTRLNLILRGRRLGFPLEEIATIINLYDEPRGQASQLSYVLDQIHDRRVDLERRQRDIQDALTELGEFESRARSELGKLRESASGLPADAEIRR
jgi:DNA-binding transcriptional MerR regulator